MTHPHPQIPKVPPPVFRDGRVPVDGPLNASHEHREWPRLCAFVNNDDDDKDDNNNDDDDDDDDDDDNLLK